MQAVPCTKTARLRTAAQDHCNHITVDAITAFNLKNVVEMLLLIINNKVFKNGHAFSRQKKF
jgi:hypothetical protein